MRKLIESVARLPKYVSVICVACLYLIVCVLTAFRPSENGVKMKRKHFSREDSLISKKAFLKVYAVLMSPRCMNCHPSGDVPLQGDDSHLHLQGVKRGPDGTGLYALKCSNCHQAHNLPGKHMPPGNPKWHLPPANMKMVFQGRSPHQLALQLLDNQKNGGKSIDQLVAHITSDSLVLSGWTPADGLAMPPLSHQQFVKVFNEWINHGAISPDPLKK